MMNQLLNTKMQEELELDRTPSSVWEKIFRIGVWYVLLATTIGTIAEAIFGEKKENETMPDWAWFLVVPYILFGAYCFNYMVFRFVKNKLIKGVWFTLMGFIAIAFLSTLLPE